jgi:hypothetical protein
MTCSFLAQPNIEILKQRSNPYEKLLAEPVIVVADWNTSHNTDGFDANGF